MKTILMTNDVHVAREADSAGVARIMVDLESHGKKERQATRTTFISTHVMSDVPKIRAVVTKGEFMVRVNGLHEQSKTEIDQVIAAGADRIMLPMITALSQLETFIQLIDGRAEILPLMETSYSMAHIGTVAAYPEVDELFIGLNDLHLSLGLDFLFEPLSLGILDWMAEKIKKHGKPFGFGGIATMGSGELPAERILGEHMRIGSSCVILSARFAKDVEMSNPEGRAGRIAAALGAMAEAEARLKARIPAEIAMDSEQTFATITQLANKLRARAHTQAQ